jgi:hypothetical protein
MSVSLAPTLITNKVRVEAIIHASAPGLHNLVAALFVNNNADAVAATFDTVPATNLGIQAMLSYEYVPGVTTLETYKVRVGPGAAGTININGNSSTRLLGGVLNCVLHATEIFVP